VFNVFDLKALSLKWNYSCLSLDYGLAEGIWLSLFSLNNSPLHITVTAMLQNFSTDSSQGAGRVAARVRTQEYPLRLPPE
jgi:hypothetical protein